MRVRRPRREPKSKHAIDLVESSRHPADIESTVMQKTIARDTYWDPEDAAMAARVHGKWCSVIQIPPATGAGKMWAYQAVRLARDAVRYREAAMELFDCSLHPQGPLPWGTYPETPLERDAKTKSQLKTQNQNIYIRVQKLHLGLFGRDGYRGSKQLLVSAAPALSPSSPSWENSTIEELLDFKIDQAIRFTTNTGSGPKRMPIFSCFFCSRRPTPDKRNTTRNDYPHRHRTGAQGTKECKVFAALGGYGNMYNVASFLLARWPHLVKADFIDDQLNGTLRNALILHDLGDLTAKAKAAIAAYENNGTIPAPGQGFRDAELRGLGTA